MKLLLLSLFGIFSLNCLHGQDFAIITVDAVSPTQLGAEFVIQLDTENAPMNVANFMMLAEPGITNFRNNSFATLTNNPVGDYRPSDENGFLIPNGSATFSIAVNGNAQVPIQVGEGAEAVVFRSQSVNPVATLILTAGSWVQQKGPFDSTDFNLNYNTAFNRWALVVNSEISYLDEFSGEVTSGPFYDNEGAIPITGLGTNHPYLGLGTRDTSTNPSPGWIIQNEMIEPSQNNFNANNNNLFGNHFANAGGTTGADQGYAVALANAFLRTPNTASSQILITGNNGNPDFEGRHTCIGTVVQGTYRNNTVIPTTTIPGSRLFVDSLLTGTRGATLRSIRFESIASTFHPLDAGVLVPSVSTQEETGAIKLDLSSLENPRILTGSSPGQVRFVDGSTDLLTWTRLGESNFPNNASEEIGLDFNISDTFPRQFFQLSPTVVSYPTWPSEDFEFLGRTIRFRGREIDVEGAPQVLSNFFITFDSSIPIAVLNGDGAGEPSGVHILTDISYQATNPYTGELSMESETLADPLRIRLYFDAHKQREFTDGIIIDRYHLLLDQVVTTPVGDILIPDQLQEFGIWQIIN